MANNKKRKTTHTTKNTKTMNLKSEQFELKTDFKQIEIPEKDLIYKAVASFYDLMANMVKGKGGKSNYVKDADVITLQWQPIKDMVFPIQMVLMTFEMEFYDNLPHRRDLLTIAVRNTKFQNIELIKALTPMSTLI
jgi:hypothetical protein